jgi:hypothetical protein
LVSGSPAAEDHSDVDEDAGRGTEAGPEAAFFLRRFFFFFSLSFSAATSPSRRASTVRKRLPKATGPSPCLLFKWNKNSSTASFSSVSGRNL